MGQYYGAYIEDSEDSKQYRTFLCPGYLKLTEHAYLKNDMVGEVMLQIWDRPSKVAWIGDYSEDGSNFGLSAEDFQKRYNRVWKHESHKTRMYSNDKIPDEKLKLYEDLSHFFVVNESKKCYISLDEYAQAYQKKTNDSPWILHPLALLTACGNGSGGGDYHTDDPFLEDAVGSWAFDIVYATYDKSAIPSDYKNVSTNWLFIED